MTYPRLTLSRLPTEEDHEFEFKCSRITLKQLSKELQRAASGFANSGGGYFVAGVDGKGNADGGIPSKNGTTPIRDWADRMLHNVKPSPKYHIKPIYDPAGRGTIKPDHIVLVVRIEESHLVPHMGPNHRYYIRAGAHTDPVQHFIVEALWAKRHFSKPRIAHLVRPKMDNQEIIQLGIVALTDAPAINVRVQVSTLGQAPTHMRSLEIDFPVEIAGIDRQTPFFFDVTTRACVERKEVPDIELSVTYQDVAGNEYKYDSTISVASSLPSLRFFKNERIEKALESISETLREFRGHDTKI